MLQITYKGSIVSILSSGSNKTLAQGAEWAKNCFSPVKSSEFIIKIFLHSSTTKLSKWVIADLINCI